MELFVLLNIIALGAGGLLGASGLIVARKPNAREVIDKLVPYQVSIGVAMLILGVLNLVWVLLHGVISLTTTSTSLYGLTMLVMTLTSILLGFLFGLPQITKWMQGRGDAGHKAAELARQIAPFQGILGVIGLASALLALLYYFHILSIV
jgi:hypothetical protein